MINKDLNPAHAELTSKLYAAMRDGSSEEQETAFANWTKSLTDDISAQAKADLEEFGNEITDEKIVAKRHNYHPLTSKERKYFAAATEKQSFDNLGEAFPETVIVDVLSRITEDHPLLQAIDLQNTNALLKAIYADPTKKVAFWGKIPDDIKQIIIDGFKVVSLDASKLSGFIAVPKGFFKLGPQYLAQYVITLLDEIMSATLETAIVAGSGKNEPIGMIKKLSGAVDGVYPDKAMVTIADLQPKSLAGVHAALAKAKTANGQVAVLVNPMDYWSRFFPQLAQPDNNNNWHLITLPTGDTIIQSYAVPEGKVVFGVAKNYLLAVSGAVELTKYEETLAIEDMDLFIAKFFGNGIAKNQNAFFVGDISTMEQATIPALEGDPDVTADKESFLQESPKA